MKPGSWSEVLVLIFGFVAGASSVAYLVLSDPEIRMMFRAKSARMQEGRWKGIAQEVARHTILEMREQFPKLLTGDV